MDPVAWHVERAQAAVDAASLAGKITVRLGVAEDLAEETARIDTIWCRDVIEVLPDLATTTGPHYQTLWVRRAYRTAEASLQLHQFLGRFIPVIYVLASGV